MNGERRSVEEIRNSLYETRGRLDRDLEELDERLHRELSLKEIFSRNPALFSIAGALVGFLLIRNPAIVTRGLTRAAQLSAPFLAKALLKKI
ncbi:MAG TPA: hypothetical protein VIG29_01920 [Vicinamibacteria bacterium]|jgi:hypothetical protein